MMIAALPVVHHFMSENMIAGLRISGIFQSDEIDNLHIAVRNDAPALRAILDAAIADITHDERRQIMARWLPTGILDQQTAVRRPAVELTPAERSWIAADRKSTRLNSSH